MSALLESLLDAERRAEIARNERQPEGIAIQPYYWPIKHLQSDEEAAAAKARRARPPQERRSVRDSRWGNFMEHA